MESDGRKYFSECVSTLVHFLQKVTIESTFQNVKEKKNFSTLVYFPQKVAIESTFQNAEKNNLISSSKVSALAHLLYKLSIYGGLFRMCALVRSSWAAMQRRRMQLWSADGGVVAAALRSTKRLKGTDNAAY